MLTPYEKIARYWLALAIKPVDMSDLKAKATHFLHLADLQYELNVYEESLNNSVNDGVAQDVKNAQSRPNQNQR